MRAAGDTNKANLELGIQTGRLVGPLGDLVGLALLPGGARRNLT